MKIPEGEGKFFMYLNTENCNEMTSSMAELDTNPKGIMQLDIEGTKAILFKENQWNFSMRPTAQKGGQLFVDTNAYHECVGVGISKWTSILNTLLLVILVVMFYARTR